MTPHGYHGQYLRINASDGSADRILLSESVLRHFVGGSGLGAYLLLTEDGARPDPFAPEAPIAFVFSPLVGSPITTSAKFAVVCKSPLTFRFNDALASSGFALAGKKVGVDAIVLSGKSPKPVVVVIDDGTVRLEHADDLWGRTTTKSEQLLRERFGNDFQFAVIGPAGERLVRFASISHDGRHAGRGGSGAILGAKNIKAIAVRGNSACSWHQQDQLVAYSKDLSARSFGPATAKYRELGTASNLLAFNRLHTLPTRNFQQATFDEAEQLAPETIQQSRSKTRASCKACTIGCEHLYQLPNSNGKVRLEYENLFALGPLCGISDADSVMAASKLCDEIGVDTISTGGTIAFAMECTERGWLDEQWLHFGDTNSLLKAVELLRDREGFGNRLAEGSRRLAESLGAQAMKIAAQVKGLELPGYEPRTLQTMALGLAVGTRGADHNRSGAYEVDFSNQVDRRNVSAKAVQLAIETENRAALLDSLILCKFLRGVFDDIWRESAQMLEMVTGWDVDADELRTTAERIVSAKKLFNVHAGWTPAEDTLPDRFFEEELPDDNARLSRTRLRELVRSYNLTRGWTADGFVPAEKHNALSLDLYSTLSCFG